MDRTNNRIGSIRFDDETVLEVSQKGGGGAGVGGAGGLEARNLITGESTNEKIEDLTEDLEDAQETIETQAQTIEDQAGTIESQAQTIEYQQAVIDAFPTIEALNATANGTYSETGKAYSPVNVNVAGLQVMNKGQVKFKIVNNTAAAVLAYVAGIQTQFGTTMISDQVKKCNANATSDTYLVPINLAFETAAQIVCTIVDSNCAAVALTDAVSNDLPAGFNITKYLTAGIIKISAQATAEAANNSTVTITID